MTAAAADPRAQSFAANGFRLSEEQEEILTTSDRFAQAEFWPLQKRMDDEEWWPPEAMPALARMGFLGVTAPDPARRRRRRLLHFGADHARTGALEPVDRAQLCRARKPVPQQYRPQRFG